MAPSSSVVAGLLLWFIINVSFLSFGHGETSTSSGRTLPSPENYWRKVLPNTTPIPKTITESIYHPEWLDDIINNNKKSTSGGVYVPLNNCGWPGCYRYAVSESQLVSYQNDPTITLFFRQTDLLHPAAGSSKTKFTIQFPQQGGSRRNHRPTPILPRAEASAIPFSSDEFSTVLERLAISPGSKEAEVMKKSISLCEDRSVVMDGEERACTTSLESMVDFVAAEIGRDSKVVATRFTVGGGRKKREYTVEGVEGLGSSSGGDGAAAVVCHKLSYPYAVFYCHKIMKTAAYEVSLVGEEGERVKAAAACHLDTTGWSPNRLIFKVLKVKPGGVVCHFLPEDSLLWVRN